MKYINTIKGSFISLIIFVILAFTLPTMDPSEDINLIITVSTFLFAILAGFFIARANSRFDEMQKLVGTEDALWLSLYKNAETISKNLAKKIANSIDKYYIVNYDFELENYNYGYKINKDYFFEIWETLQKLTKEEKNSQSYQVLLNLLSSIEVSRNLASTVARERIGIGQWLSLTTLGIIILFSLFYIKTTEPYSMIITILMSTTLIMVLLIMRDLENFKFGGDSLLEESGQEVLEFIGKPRYYSQYFLKQGYYHIPKSVKEYRVGLHKAGEKFNIKTVKNI